MAVLNLNIPDQEQIGDLYLKIKYFLRYNRKNIYSTVFGIILTIIFSFFCSIFVNFGINTFYNTDTLIHSNNPSFIVAPQPDQHIK